MNKPYAEWTREQKDRHNARINAYKRAHRELYRQKAQAHRNTEQYKRTRRAYLDRTKNHRREVRLAWLKTRARPKTRLREFVMARDGDRCSYCGLPGVTYRGLIPNASWHLDHIVPRSHGGGDGRANIALACQFCNYAKSNVSRDVFLTWLQGMSQYMRQ